MTEQPTKPRAARRCRALAVSCAIGLAALALGAPPPAHAQIFMSKSQEKEIGASEHPKILEQYGGVYPEFELSAYIAGIGGRVAANSDDPSLGYTVTFLNSPVVNAFALPGGYVYVTRGLVALANSEAELAGVLGHEVGHVTARHTAKRYDRAVGTSLFGTILGAVVGSPIISDIIGLGGAAYLASFSRSQEYEADIIGVGVLTRAGYDPYAQGDFLATMGMQAELEAKIRGAEPSRMEFFSTHPNTKERVLRAIDEARAQGATVAARPRLRDAYLDKVDGMIYGDDPKEGFVRGQTFIHPILKFSFVVPNGFQMQNTSRAVAAKAKDGSLIIFDGRKVSAGTDPARHVSGDFSNELEVRARNIEQFTVNGMKAATGTVSNVNTQQGRADLRLVAIQFAPDQMYRFVFLTPRNRTKALDPSLRQTAMSFRRISDAEAGTAKPLRIRIVTAKAGDTVASLSSRMTFNDYREERFRVLNGLGPSDGVVSGSRYKIVTE